MEIPSQISAEVSCTGDLRDYRNSGRTSETVDVDLKGWLNLSNEDKKILSENGTITKDGKVKVEQDGKAWEGGFDVERYGPSRLQISSSSRSDSLDLEVKYTVIQGGIGHGASRGITLTCKDPTLKNTAGKSEVLYSEGTGRGKDGNYRKVHENTRLKVRVSLENCLRKDEEQFECPLKVISYAKIILLTPYKK